MTCLHVITESAPFGGAQRNTLLTLRGLARGGGRVELACGPGGRLVDEARALGVPVHVLDDLVRRPDPVRDLRALLALYRLARGGRYTIVHTHSTKAGILGRLAARAARVPVIVHTHHSVPFELGGGPAAAAYRALERALARITDRVVCVGDVLRREVADLGMAPASKLVTIHSGIEFSECAARRPVDAVRRDLGLGDAGPVIGSVGRLCTQKSQLDLVEAVRLLVPRRRRIRLVLAGEGPLRPALERRIAGTGLSGIVRLLGERDDVGDVLSAVDVYAMSSRWEGVGRALTEAMSRGLPVVATAVNGVTELVVDGETGLLVPPRDPRALAAAIERLLADPPLARRLGRAGQERVMATMEADRMVAAIEALYAALTGERSARGVAAEAA